MNFSAGRCGTQSCQWKTNMFSPLNHNFTSDSKWSRWLYPQKPPFLKKKNLKCPGYFLLVHHLFFQWKLCNLFTFFEWKKITLMRFQKLTNRVEMDGKILHFKNVKWKYLYSFFPVCITCIVSRHHINIHVILEKAIFYSLLRHSSAQNIKLLQHF